MSMKGELLALHCMLEAVIAKLPAEEQEQLWKRFQRNAELLRCHLDPLGRDAFDRATTSLAARSAPLAYPELPAPPGEFPHVRPHCPIRTLS